MTFIELDYLFVFLPLVTVLYYLFRATIRANIIILAASYYFYGAMTPWYLIPLVVTSLIDFLVGIRLSKTERKSARRAWLVLSLVANLGLLGFFKYTPWLIREINQGLAVAGMGVELPALAVVLAPGICSTPSRR
jgi:alginate O-acetyltransferase complex protein AlgI